MADSVARYLVTEHQVPLYRIYRTGLGKGAPAATNAASNDQTAAANGANAASSAQSSDTVITNGVRVTLLHNSLASMSEPSAPGAPANNGNMPANNSNSYAPQGQQPAPASNQ
jgi:hypothetical protein